jgi:hypothetical protein
MLEQNHRLSRRGFVKFIAVLGVGDRYSEATTRAFLRGEWPAPAVP